MLLLSASLLATLVPAPAPVSEASKKDTYLAAKQLKPRA